MAGASLLALIDDIATILDDVSVMTKVAAKKTAGVLENGGNEIHIEESVRAKAAVSIQRMLDFAAAEKAGTIQLGD